MTKKRIALLLTIFLAVLSLIQCQNPSGKSDFYIAQGYASLIAQGHINREEIIPKQIEMDRLEKEILSKIPKEEDKKFILTLYSKDSNGNFYTLKKNFTSQEESKIIEISNSFLYNLLWKYLKKAQKEGWDSSRFLFIVNSIEELKQISNGENRSVNPNLIVNILEQSLYFSTNHSSNNGPFFLAITRMYLDLLNANLVPKSEELIRQTGHILESYLQKNPNDLNIWSWFAYFLYTEEQAEKMAEYADYFINRFSNNASLHNQVAWFFATVKDIKKRDPKRALKHAKIAYETMDGFPDKRKAAIIDTLAEAFFVNDDLPKALVAIKKAISLDPFEIEFQNRYQKYKEYIKLKNPQDIYALEKMEKMTDSMDLDSIINSGEKK